MTYQPATTAILLVDPYNDFSARAASCGRACGPSPNRCISSITSARCCRPRGPPDSRSSACRIAAGKPGDYVSFDNPSPYQLGSAKAEVFAKDSWGGTFHDDFQPEAGDVVVLEHWGSSGFANTDLGLQLKQHGIRRIVLIGMIANTCLESTGRFGMELGYHVTLVTDATAAFNPEALHAAHAINGPTYAHAIVSTDELVAQLSA